MSFFSNLANIFSSTDVDSDYMQTIASSNGVFSNNQHFSQYINNPFLKTYVDLKVTDATRAGISFTGENSINLNEDFASCNIMQKIKQALIEARICGGAGIIVVDNATKGLDYPLNLDVIKPNTTVTFQVFSSQNLQADPNYKYDLLKEDYRNIEYYQLVGSNVEQTQQIHASRVIPFYGTPLLSFDMQSVVYGSYLGWGRSIIDPISEAAEEFAEVYITLPKIIKKANMDIISFDAASGMDGGAAHNGLQQSFAKLTNKINKMAEDNKAMILPAGDYQRLSNNLTGYSDVIKEMVQFLASSESYPIMYFMGLQQAGGLLNNASADMKKYAYAVHEMQENQIRENLNTLLKIWSKTKYNTIYEDITKYEFKSIDVPSEEEKITTEQKIINNVLQLYKSDLVSAETALRHLQESTKIPISEQDIKDAIEDEQIENERLEENEEAREST